MKKSLRKQSATIVLSPILPVVYPASTLPRVPNILYMETKSNKVHDVRSDSLLILLRKAIFVSDATCGNKENVIRKTIEIERRKSQTVL